MTTPSGTRVVLVAAVARNRVIGDGPRIPWRLPGEQRMFKELTWGHTLLMGRATYDSIGRPLPGRTTVVLTRDPEWTAAPEVRVAHDLDAALDLVEPGTDVYVAGGAAVYAAVLERDGLADEQVISEVPLTPEGDVLYPAYDEDAWREVSRKPREGYAVVRRVRVSAGE